jgi:hypothetical protein
MKRLDLAWVISNPLLLPMGVPLAESSRLSTRAVPEGLREWWSLVTPPPGYVQQPICDSWPCIRFTGSPCMHDRYEVEVGHDYGVGERLNRLMRHRSHVVLCIRQIDRMFESPGVFTSEVHDMELRGKSEEIEGHPFCRNSLYLQINA